MATKTFTNLSRIWPINRLASGFSKRQSHSHLSALKPELELCFNNQINMEFFAGFTYLAMATFFGRQNISLPGCYNYFLNQAHEEQNHAQKLIDYLNKRGNCVCLQTIQQPKNNSWESPLAAFKEALELENIVSQKLFQLYEHSEGYNDVCACNFLENEFLEEQVEEIDELSRLVAQLEKIGPEGLGIYLFDRHLLKNK